MIERYKFQIVRKCETERFAIVMEIRPLSKYLEMLGNNINQPAGFRHGKFLA